MSAVPQKKEGEGKDFNKVEFLLKWGPLKGEKKNISR